MRVSAGPIRLEVDLGHLAFVGALAAYSVWRLVDARSASASFYNLLLIQPTVVVALILALIIARSTIRRISSTENTQQQPDDADPLPRDNIEGERGLNPRMLQCAFDPRVATGT